MSTSQISGGVFVPAGEGGKPRFRQAFNSLSVVEDNLGDVARRRGGLHLVLVVEAVAETEFDVEDGLAAPTDYSENQHR